MVEYFEQNAHHNFSENKMISSNFFSFVCPIGMGITRILLILIDTAYWYDTYRYCYWYYSPCRGAKNRHETKICERIQQLFHYYFFLKYVMLFPEFLHLAAISSNLVKSAHIQERFVLSTVYATLHKYWDQYNLSMTHAYDISVLTRNHYQLVSVLNTDPYCSTVQNPKIVYNDVNQRKAANHHNGKGGTSEWLLE